MQEDKIDNAQIEELLIQHMDNVDRFVKEAINKLEE